MGLDILLFDKENRIIGKREISLSLHEEIFYGKFKSNFGSYFYLKKLKDYYKTNIIFKDSEIKEFLNDLTEILPFLDGRYKNELIGLIKELDNEMVYKVHIAGD